MFEIKPYALTVNLMRTLCKDNRNNSLFVVAFYCKLKSLSSLAVKVFHIKAGESSWLLHFYVNKGPTKSTLFVSFNNCHRCTFWSCEMSVQTVTFDYP